MVGFSLPPFSDHVSSRQATDRAGFYTLLLSLGITVGILLQPGGIEAYTYLYDNWIPLVSASMVMAIFQATWVYFYSFYTGELLALGGNSGVFIYDVGLLLISSNMTRACKADKDSGSLVVPSIQVHPVSPLSTSKHSTKSDQVSSSGFF